MGKEQMASVSTHRKRSLPRNQLLAAMSASDFALLRPHLKPIAMPVFKDMEQPNRLSTRGPLGSRRMGSMATTFLQFDNARPK